MVKPTMSEPERPVLLKTSEVAHILGVHPETLRRWVRSGKFRAEERSLVDEKPRYHFRGDGTGTDRQRCVSVRDAALALHKHPNTVKRWIRDGKLKAVCTPGGHYRIPASELPHPPVRTEPLTGAELPPVPNLSPPDPSRSRFAGPLGLVGPSELRRSFHLKLIVPKCGHEVVGGGPTYEKRGRKLIKNPAHVHIRNPNGGVDSYRISAPEFPHPAGYLQLRGRRLYLHRITRKEWFHITDPPESRKPKSRLIPLLDLTENQARFLYGAKLRDARIFIERLIAASCEVAGRSHFMYGAIRGRGRKRKPRAENRRTSAK